MTHKRSLVFAALVLVAPSALAENQTWATLDLKTAAPGAPQFEYSLTTELRIDPNGDIGTISLRPGIGYKVNDTLKISGGYRYASSRKSGPDTIEHRFWEQAAYDLFEAAGGEFAGRTRFEQRWRDGKDGTGWRVRQQISYERPISGTGLKFNLSDEMIVGLNNTNWGHADGLQENRAKAVLKWKTGGAGLEFGYLNQHKNGINGADDETNHHIVVGLSKAF